MPLISLDIRMLRSFVSVVQTGSITVTARQLGRTQPAITLQLQRLEELVDKTLLHHEGRRQLLTDDGDLVLSYAKSILRLHDEMLQRLASRSASPLFRAAIVRGSGRGTPTKQDTRTSPLTFA